MKITLVHFIAVLLDIKDIIPGRKKKKKKWRDSSKEKNNNVNVQNIKPQQSQQTNRDSNDITNGSLSFNKQD